MGLRGGSRGWMICWRGRSRLGDSLCLHTSSLYRPLAIARLLCPMLVLLKYSFLGVAEILNAVLQARGNLISSKIADWPRRPNPLPL
jgi:hypothetical protein